MRRRAQPAGICCSFVGQVGYGPVLQWTRGGTPLARFSVGVVDPKGPELTWLACVVLGTRADDPEILGAITPGAQVLVEGRLRVEQRTDRDGRPYRDLLIIVRGCRPADPSAAERGAVQGMVG